MAASSSSVVPEVMAISADVESAEALLPTPAAEGASTSRGIGPFRIVLGVLAVSGAALTILPSSQKPLSQSTVGNAVELVAVEADAFDCTAGLKSWREGWSVLKKRWCCQHKQVGCDIPGDSSGGAGTEPKPFDCRDGLSNWDAGWSRSKKHWCCNKEDLGCHEENELKATWVYANIPYTELRQSPYLPEQFEVSVKNAVAQSAANCGVTRKNITLRYWAGSALHSRSFNTSGVVARIVVVLGNPKSFDCVKLSLESPVFAQIAATSMDQHLVGLPTGAVGVHDLTVDPQSGNGACECPGGVAATGRDCVSKGGGHVCQSCKEGHYMTSLSQCLVNECKCHGGNPARGTMCPVHQEKKCVSCFKGWHFNTTIMQCQPNECHCAMGFPASGAECFEHHATICGSCYPGLYVDTLTKECVHKSCSCKNGIAAHPEDCLEDGKEQCLECDLGYHVDPVTLKCEVNFCSCRDGKEAVGVNCRRHGEEVCAACNPGLYLHEDRCSNGKTCVCPNGVPATGELCSTNGATICTRCHPGFVEMQSQCVEKPCQCTNGVAKVGAKCDFHNEVPCDSCNDGYFLEGERCVAKECKCENGVAAKGSECHSNGAESCGSCNAGYRSDLTLAASSEGDTRLVVKCMPNKCTCNTPDGKPAGIPASGEHQDKCFMDGGNVCVRCFDNHKFSQVNSSSCVPNVCECENGYAVDVDECRAHGLQACKSCKHGYWLATDGAYAQNEDYQGFGKETYTEIWKDGRAVCLPAAATTSEEFDCQAGLRNFELAWSPMKKFWCCEHKQLGCKAKLTTQQACENMGFNEDQCASPGCCEFIEGHCKARVGYENELCHPDFTIVSKETNHCLASKEIWGGSGGRKIAVLSACSDHSSNELWHPNQANQITDALGNCLMAVDLTQYAKVEVVPCILDKSVVGFAQQHFKYEQEMFKIAGNCLEVFDCADTDLCSKEFRLNTCDNSTKQLFTVQVAPA